MDFDTGIQALLDAEYPQGVEWYEGKMRPCETRDIEHSEQSDDEGESD